MNNHAKFTNNIRKFLKLKKIINPRTIDTFRGFLRSDYYFRETEFYKKKLNKK